MKKIYKALTKDQVSRGVVFSSTLSNARTEQPEDIIHEVFQRERDKDRIIRNLKDDSFFDDGPWAYNIIRREV